MLSWKALKTGTSRIWLHKRILVWLYLINVLFAAVLVLPFRNLVSEISKTDLSDDFVTGFHLDAFLDFWVEYMDSFQALGLAAVVLGGLYLLVSILLTGGIVATLADASRVTLRRFFTNAGRYFWRFLRVFVVMAIVIGGLLAANAQWVKPYVDSQKELVTTDRESFYWSAGNVGVVLLVASLVLMVFDYAKIRTVVERRRSVFFASLRGLAFVLRRPVRTVTLFFMNLGLLCAMFAVYLLIENRITASTLPMLIALFLLQQVFILGRIWMKLSFFSSQVALFQDAMAVEVVPVPQTPAPEESIRRRPGVAAGAVSHQPSAIG